MTDSYEFSTCRWCGLAIRKPPPPFNIPPPFGKPYVVDPSKWATVDGDVTSCEKNGPFGEHRPTPDNNPTAPAPG
jgi:hypothetical protein